MAILRQVGFQDMGFRLSYDARSLARNPGVETLLYKLLSLEPRETPSKQHAYQQTSCQPGEGGSEGGAGSKAVGQEWGSHNRVGRRRWSRSRSPRWRSWLQGLLMASQPSKWAGGEPLRLLGCSSVMILFGAHPFFFVGSSRSLFLSHLDFLVSLPFSPLFAPFFLPLLSLLTTSASASVNRKTVIITVRVFVWGGL